MSLEEKIAEELKKCSVVWNTEDIAQVLRNAKIEPTQENILKFVTSRPLNKMIDHLISSGFEYMDTVVKEVFN